MGALAAEADTPADIAACVAELNRRGFLPIVVESRDLTREEWARSPSGKPLFENSGHAYGYLDTFTAIINAAPGLLATIADLEARLAASEAARDVEIRERDEWRRAAQDQTPGGSEFTTPAECLAYVRDLRARHIAVLKTFKDRAEKAEAALADARKAMKAVLNADTHPLHVGYDEAPGGGNYVYVDAIRVDDEAFALMRVALTTAAGDGT